MQRGAYGYANWSPADSALQQPDRDRSDLVRKRQPFAAEAHNAPLGPTSLEPVERQERLRPLPSGTGGLLDLHGVDGLILDQQKVDLFAVLVSVVIGRRLLAPVPPPFHRGGPILFVQNRAGGGLGRRKTYRTMVHSPPFAARGTGHPRRNHLPVGGPDCGCRRDVSTRHGG